MKIGMTTQESREQQPRSLVALWLGILGPPAIWLTQFEIRYVLAARPATSEHPFVLIGVWVISLALVAFLALAARWQDRAAAAAPLDVEAGVVSRTRFMAKLGLMSCALFALLILGQGLADFFFQPG